MLMLGRFCVLFSLMLAARRAVAWTSKSGSTETSFRRLYHRLPTLPRPGLVSPAMIRQRKPPSFSSKALYEQSLTSIVRGMSDSTDDVVIPDFQPGDKIQVEIMSFGPLGAGVEVIGLSHDSDSLISETDPPLALGLILQREIRYFRQGRNNVDVVQGEVLPAYVERVRETGRVDVSLRAFGGKAKALEVSDLILNKLNVEPVLCVGDKSSPKEIAAVFPGVSKASFKRAVSALYKQGKVQPNATSISLMTDN
ncbi:predicted protein [Phaeodactylum tricornutum CCAP 1055/1]|jgi:hypothetical protein|uniref:Conserved virulence factor B-like winged helix domain-containing protein n=1 Tax=Phaeodactylum tricornutum (strain CCAP 1055/1) TaxID=556484 RepID=B7FR94_PHATC|nr:predicted protein [Phaeodactylum tricornutum CCAP 1055/1]EEC51464.1 predicted protein [Phaeodactylum tricornutum CCAP 1055/1]|eukprot:XP_002177001.1 predicted protein [Phaeodactylum tricornutum CCAP 1055/1]